jgi:hypothetical protein
MTDPTAPRLNTNPDDVPASRNGDGTTIAVFFGPRRTRPKTVADRLDRLFLEWAWFTHHHDWMPAVRTLARGLRGLEGAGLVERRRARGSDGRPLHLLELTPLGRSALLLLSGDDSESADRQDCAHGAEERR